MCSAFLRSICTCSRWSPAGWRPCLGDRVAGQAPSAPRSDAGNRYPPDRRRLRWPAVRDCLSLRPGRRLAAGRPVAGGAIYAMSIGVYCTSWTFYGSVGRASVSGVDFLPIYLGPTLTFCLGWPLLAKMLRVSKTYRITSIADFIASRYGKSASARRARDGDRRDRLDPLYRACSSKRWPRASSCWRSPADPVAMAKITAVVAAPLLAAFAILFGTRHIDASEHHQGLSRPSRSSSWSSCSASSRSGSSSASRCFRATPRYSPRPRRARNSRTSSGSTRAAWTGRR